MRLTLTLRHRKKEETQRSGHWKTVLVGDEEIDTRKFGPQQVYKKRKED